MFEFSPLQTAAIIAALAWPAIAIAAAAFGAAALQQRHPGWRRAAIALAAVLALDTLLTAPLVIAFIRHQANEIISTWQARQHTYRLDNGARPRIEKGTLAQSAQVMGLTCGAGPVKYDADEVRCVLAGDQTVMGIPLAATQRPSFIRTEKASSRRAHYRSRGGSSA